MSDPQTTDWASEVAKLAARLEAMYLAGELPEPRPLSERERLLQSAKADAEHAVDCMRAGDWLKADILLKLAVDQIDDAGVVP